jgi:hypothetical protein
MLTVYFMLVIFADVHNDVPGRALVEASTRLELISGECIDRHTSKRTVY